ncbi:MAG: phage terminase small subunit P27 family [Lysobacterales bacterium]
MNEQTHPGFRLAEVPPPPDTLSAGARAEWPWLAETVWQLGKARGADLRALELLCELLADCRAMEAAIRRDGMTTKAGSGGVKAHPALSSLAAARKHAEGLMVRFGLMPHNKQAEQFSHGRAQSLYSHCYED